MRRIQVEDRVVVRALKVPSTPRMEAVVEHVIKAEERFFVRVPNVGCVPVTALEIEWDWIHVLAASLRSQRKWYDGWFWGFFAGLMLGASRLTNHTAAVCAGAVTMALITLMTTYLVD